MPTTSRSGGIKGALTNKHGGIPGWVLLAGAGAVAWWYFNRKPSTAASDGTDPTGGQSTVPHGLRGPRGLRGHRGARGRHGGPGHGHGKGKGH